MSFLEVPGARLFYETHGDGPLLILIHGANGTGDVFRGLVDTLAEHFTVVTYDRRGFTRSQLIGNQGNAGKLETDANDVRLLIEKLSAQPAMVFGSSSGAIVALEAFISHPGVVQKLCLHEPPIMRFLPDGHKWTDFFSEVYDLFHESGAEPALQKFRKEMLAESDRQAASHAPRNEYSLPNFTYWIEHELRQYTSIDIETDMLKKKANLIIPLAGDESRGYPAYEAIAELAMRLGKDLIELPGGHNGYLTNPSGFSQILVDSLLST